MRLLLPEPPQPFRTWSGARASGSVAGYGYPGTGVHAAHDVKAKNHVIKTRARAKQAICAY